MGSRSWDSPTGIKTIPSRLPLREGLWARAGRISCVKNTKGRTPLARIRSPRTVRLPHYFKTVGYNLAMIVINDYNPAWPTEFEVIRLSLLDILGPLALRIDHIGSTSVPGLGAKDVIDIQITVEALAPEVRQRLIEAGYEYWEAITQDHVPLGEDDDPKLWAKCLFNQPNGRRRANVHVRLEGNPNQRYPLLFRDYLRAHPNSARTIELIKREIVKRHADDTEAYYDIKDPVYDLIWDAAQAWTSQTSWKP